ncbi:unnamed protein product, partial [Closterium sp. NIES-53]
SQVKIKRADFDSSSFRRPICLSNPRNETTGGMWPMSPPALEDSLPVAQSSKKRTSIPKERVLPRLILVFRVSFLKGSAPVLDPVSLRPTVSPGHSLPAFLCSPPAAMAASLLASTLFLLSSLISAILFSPHSPPLLLALPGEVRRIFLPALVPSAIDRAGASSGWVGGRQRLGLPSFILVADG